MVNQRKVFITGYHGQLGKDLSDLLSINFDVKGIDIETVDITDYEVISAEIEKFNPEFVLHCAAYTAVDDCETNREKALKINGEATGNIARICQKIDAKIIYYSTDYVFDGLKKSPYFEDETPNPQTIYGQSKLLGEKLIAEGTDNYIILRIAWLFGRYGNNFLKTMLKLAKNRLKTRKSDNNIPPLKIINDQFGNPTWTIDIARQTERLLEGDYKGLFHCTSENVCTWYDFAKIIFDKMDLEISMEPCTTDQFPRPAPRPPNSALENRQLKNLNQNLMPEYNKSIEQFLELYGKKLLSEM